MTPYVPQPIEDKTTIDIGHEALIRCWRRISAKEGGWLQEEIRDGLAWRTLLYQGETFAGDQSSFLSAPAAEIRAKWLEERNAAWAERYGGGWPKVAELIEKSRAHGIQEAERQAANRRMEIDIERLRREAAEQSEDLAKKSELLAMERARRSRAVALISIGAAIVTAAYASWGQLRSEFYRLAHTAPLEPAQERALKAGDPIKECRDCPEMIVVPARRFTMGSPEGQGYEFERPQHEVTIAKPFAVAKFSLTFDEWKACVDYGDCDPRIGDSGWGRGRRPVINVTWEDAETYVRWLSRMTRRQYRLLSEAEYEYAARAGTETQYPWGDEIKLDGKAMANCRACGSEWGGKQTALVGSFPANRFGLYDMVGNVWEWTQDCWHHNYDGAPADGSAWTSGNDCATRVVRGGSWNGDPGFLRSAYRGRNSTGVRNSISGFGSPGRLPPKS